MAKLTPNFTLEEMCASSTATARHIDNTPTESVKINLRALCENVLQPLRDAYGKSIVINSGYRCKKLNSAVGGSKTSQHMTGEAADIRCNNKVTREWIFDYIKTHLTFDQLILEHNSSGTYWVHVSYRKDGKNRKQVIADMLKK